MKPENLVSGIHNHPDTIPAKLDRVGPGKLLVQNYYLLLALVIATAFAVWAQAPRILDPFQVEEDFRNLYWVRLFENPDLFQGDPYIDNHIVRFNLGDWTMDYAIASPGYGLLFMFASPIVDPLLFSKLLIFPLLLASVYFIYRIGEQLSDRGTAFALAFAFMVINLASHSAISVTGGLQRSFSMPIILGLIYYLMQKRYGWAALFVFLGGVIYAPLFPLGAVTYGFSLLERGVKLWRPRIIWKPLAPLFLASILVLVTMSPKLITLAEATQTSATELISEGQHSLTDAAFGRHGRWQIFHLFPIWGRGGFASGHTDAFHMVMLGALALAIWLIRGRRARPFPSILNNLFYASIFNFSLAWLGFLATSAFPLYLPSRYTQATFILLLLFFIALNGEEALHIAAAWLKTHSHNLTWPLLLIALLATALALLVSGNGDTAPLWRSTEMRVTLVVLCTILVLLTAINRNRSRANYEKEYRQEPHVFAPSTTQGRVLGVIFLLVAPLYIEALERDFYNPPPAERELYRFLETLPEDTLVGGAPCLLDGVPLYSKRQVLFSCDRPLNIHAISASILAYYAEDVSDVEAFCRNHGVDVFVVNRRDYGPAVLAESYVFFEPYHSLTYPTIKNRQHFVLEQIDTEARLFESGDLYVLQCSAQALAQE